MKISFKSLKLENFKNHKKLEINFGGLTRIEGRNGEGKSSIAESISWLLFGTDPLGSKFDPKPIGAGSKVKTIVDLTLSVDGKERRFRKEQAAKAEFFVDEVPSKATPFDAEVKELFERNLFLSIFNPSFFFTQHWQEQRAQLLKYIPEPFEPEVLEQMEPLQREKLVEGLKKNSVDELHKIHHPRIKAKDTELTRSGAVVENIQGRIDSEAKNGLIPDVIKTEMQQLKKQITEAQSAGSDGSKERFEYQNIQNDLRRLKSEIEAIGNEVKGLQKEGPKDSCNVCGQNLEGEAAERAESHHKKQMADKAAAGQKFLKQFKELKEKEKAIVIPEQKERVDTSELQERYFALQNDLAKVEQINSLEKQLHEEQAKYKEIRKELLQSQAIVEAVKAYNTKKSEMTAVNANELLRNLTVQLFEMKKNGSINPTFEVEMSGKPYSKLSTAEKIRAGLELAEVLIEKSGKSIPVFVDNAESILSFLAPNGQLITATVKDTDLKIEVEGENK